jgi:6-phosphogluconolactonase (cycloisomerase 2 family)
MRPTSKPLFVPSQIKHWRIALTALLLTALLTGGCSTATHSSHLAYVTTSSGVNGFRVDAISGAVTSIFSSPFVVGNSPYGIVIDPSNQFAYVANQGDNTISLLKIDATSGTLKEIQPRTNAGQSPGPMILDANGSFLYVANQGSNDISVFSVGSNGGLSPVTQPSGGLTVPVGSIPTTLSMPSSGNLLFVSVPAFSTVYAFTVSSGALAPAAGSPVPVPNGLSSVAASPSGNFVYVTNPATNTISGFSIQASSTQNVLQVLPGSPFPDVCGTSSGPCTSPFGAAVDPSGKYLYVANYSSTGVSQFTINGSTGALTNITKTAPTAGTNASFIVFDPRGTYVYVANVGSRSITQLKLNSDGSLASTSSSIQLGGVPRAFALTR